MSQELQPVNPNPFERIRRTNEHDFDFWNSRELAPVLGYTDYRNFEAVIKKAQLACFNSGQEAKDHFVEYNEMVEIGSGAKRELKSLKLSRYACYLIIQNANPGKEIIARGQTYFAVQTRRQELTDQSSENELRLRLREEMKDHNKRLAGTAKEAGVVKPLDYAIFQNHGYMGLYGGLMKQDIHRKKGLKKGQEILDHMGSTELAANLFRATQTEDKIRREKIIGKDKANQTHAEVGKKVRQTIQELGGTLPEHLPPAENIKKVATRTKRVLKGPE